MLTACSRYDASRSDEAAYARTVGGETRAQVHKVDPLHTARNGLGRLRDRCPDPPRPFGPFANDAVIAGVEPHVPRGGRHHQASIVVLAGRATYVP